MPIIHLEDGVPPSTGRIVIINEAYTDAVLAGHTNEHVHTPPAGYLWQILTMYLYSPAPAGGTTGLHETKIANEVSTMLEGRSVFSSGIKWYGSMWDTADSSQKPSSEIAALHALNAAEFDSDRPLRLIYNNYTDVTATGTRHARFMIKETPKI